LSRTISTDRLFRQRDKLGQPGAEKRWPGGRLHTLVYRAGRPIRPGSDTARTVLQLAHQQDTAVDLLPKRTRILVRRRFRHNIWIPIFTARGFSVEKRYPHPRP